MSSSLPPVLIVTEAPTTVEPVVRFLQARDIAAHLIRDIDDEQFRHFLVVPALILIDAGLPGDAAFALCRRLKQGADTRSIPVVMLLPANGAEARAKAFEAGADDYLLTPLQAEELEARLAPRMHGRTELETLHLALEAALDAAFLCNSKGQFLYVNEAACRSLGYTRAELLKLDLTEIDPIYADRQFDTDKAAIAEGDDIRTIFPSMHRHRDGREFPVEVGVSTFRIGDTVFALCIVRDITARKAAEEKLHASEQAFRATVENSPDLISRYDRDFRRIYMNPAFLRHCYQQADELLGKTPLEAPVLMDPRDFVQRLQQVVQEKKEIEQEIPIRDAAGELRWGHVRLVPEFDAQDNVVSILSIGRDITTIKESENRFRTLAENFPDPLMRFDWKARHTYVNPAAVEAFGLPSEDFVGKRPDQLAIYGKQAESISTAIRKAFSSSLPGIEEVQLPTAQGEQIYEMRFIPKRDSSRSMVAVLVIGRNVTQLKVAQRQLEESYKLLQELSSRRETAREDERKRMAREIHDELGQRLTAIRLKMGMLKLQKCAEPCNLEAPVAALIDMTDQTLKVVRDVSALLRPAALELGINPGLDWLADEFQRNTGISCALDLMVIKPVLTETQATALFRCAQESLTNVARHSGATEVRISLEEVDDDYVMEIEDDGHGFDIASPKLSCFGLAGMKERMLSVGGTATVESTPDHGTRVRVSLPVGNNKNDGR